MIYKYGGGVRGKKYVTIMLGFLMGAMSLGLGFFMDAGLTGGTATPSLGPIIVFEVLGAIFCECVTSIRCVLTTAGWPTVPISRSCRTATRTTTVS